MKTKNKILFIYQNGRKEKIESNVPYAKEMFYGYHYFNENDYQAEIIEFETNKGLLNKLFINLIEKKLRNGLKLPVYWSFLTNKKNFQKLKSTNYAVFSNNRVGFSSLIIIYLLKLINKKPKTLCFVMGLFSRHPKYKLFLPIQNFLLKFFVNNLDKLIFLSRAEYEFACNKYPKNKESFFVLPFSVDLSIWNIQKDVKKKKQILFVGNDGFRDFKFAEKLANKFKNINFVFVSQEINNSNLNENSVVFSGSWGKNSLNDVELSKLYNESFLTIVPLKNSLQPSGQSVTLQSLACGTPVLITKTDGFWDEENFINNENIIFLEENSIDLWQDQILNLFENENKYNRLRKNGLNLVETNYDLNIFSELVEKILIS